jgi:hypothetical protein
VALDGSQSPCFELLINGAPGTKLGRQHFSPNNIPNGQLELLGVNQWKSLLHNDLIKLHTDDGQVASFRIEFSQIQVEEPCIPSSEYQTPMDVTNSRRPVSVISETPAAERSGLSDEVDLESRSTHAEDEFIPRSDDDLNLDSRSANAETTRIIPDSETESEAEQKPAPSSSSGKRKNEGEADAEKPPKRQKSSTPSPNPTKKPRGRPRKVIDDHKGSSTMVETTLSPTPDASNTPTSSQTPKAMRAKRKPVVVFSGSAHVERAMTKAFLKKHIQITEDVGSNIDFLCVGNGKLKTTSKILKAITLGKPIIDDKWVTECLKARSLLDHMEFLASDPEAEEQHKVPATWSGGSADIGRLLKGKTIYATPTLRKQYGEGWKSLSSILLTVGAKKPVSYPARDVRKGDPDLIVLGLDSNDEDAYELFMNGFQVWNKDLISYGILRGKVDLKSKEFRRPVENPHKKKTVPKR